MSRDDVAPPLVVENLTRRWGEALAVDDLSFTAERGAILGFLGPNGAGKTTTLRMILGLVVPTAGRALVLGTTEPARVRHRIGFLPEERGLYRRMTPVSAIVFLARLKGVPAALAARRARALLESQGLAVAADRPIRLLSKGMAQKVQLLASLAHEPELVILDEPFSGLDPLNQQALEDLIRGLSARGATVVFSTHVMQHAERLCDRVVLLARGRKVFDGGLEAARACCPRLIVLEGEGVDRVSFAGLQSMASEPIEGQRRRLTASLSPGAGPQEILHQAFAAGCAISRFEVREPTLHDAFLQLTREAAA